MQSPSESDVTTTILGVCCTNSTGEEATTSSIIFDHETVHVLVQALKHVGIVTTDLLNEIEAETLWEAIKEDIKTEGPNQAYEQSLGYAIGLMHLPTNANLFLGYIVPQFITCIALKAKYYLYLMW